VEFIFAAVPWHPWGPTFFDRGYYHHGHLGFLHRYPSPENFDRGFNGGGLPLPYRIVGELPTTHSESDIARRVSIG